MNSFDDVPTFLAGIPIITALLGTSFVTTALAPIFAFSPITTGKVFTSTHISLFFSYNLHIASKLFLCFAWTIISCFALSSTSVGAPNLSKSVLTFFVEIVVSVILASQPNKTKTTPIKKLTKYLIS